MPENEYKHEFAEFAHILADLFQGNDSPEEFTKAMFKAIYLPVEEDSPLDDVEDRTYRSYFYDEHDITVLAKKITGSLDPDGFAEFVNTDTDSTVKKLCEEFKKYYPDIDAENYGKRVGARFETIIRNAAAAKRKRRTKKPAGIIPIDSKPQLIETPKDKYGIYLVSEEGSKCPNDGCPHMLYGNVNGRPELIYDVVEIDPDESSDDPNNLIALCPDCAARYRLSRSPLFIYRMRQIKDQVKNDTENFELISDQRIQEGVRRVIEKIPKMKPDTPVDLNYNPGAVRQKIKPEHNLLYMKAKMHVDYYYRPVNDALQEMGREGLLRYKPFCEQVRMNYLMLEEQGRDQPTIYRLLTDWLQSGTNEERDYCEVVISFFIQNCEVFNVTA